MPERTVREAGPHHVGHRERLRERALAHGLATSPDYEVLELYLFRSARMADVKPKAKALLARFGSLGAVLSASLPQLMSVPGIGEVAALDLKLVRRAGAADRARTHQPAHGVLILVGSAVLRAGWRSSTRAESRSGCCISKGNS